MRRLARISIYRVRTLATRGRLKQVARIAVALSFVWLCALVIAWQALPCPIESLRDPPGSAAVFDSSGRLLMQSVARDDQWRFPVRLADISPWLVQATIAIEDERFASHAGVDPIAVVRAVMQNVSSLGIRSGASTLTMQLACMAEPRPRTWWAKAVQAMHALKLDRSLDKDAQLECYFNLAPYGGNISGAEAASRLYFGRSARVLTLGQAALLAGLPQSPSRYRPDRHFDRAIARRSVVLRRMLELGMISPEQFDDADTHFPIIARGQQFDIAPHFADLARSRRPRGGQTLLRREIQIEVNRVAVDHGASLPANTDVAVVVIEIATGDVVALVGGTRTDDALTGRVNGATARRSPGSALKPFIYAAAVDADMLDANTVVYDIPIDRDGWTPDNFDRITLGPMPAAQALRRSRNVPAILITEAIGPARCVGLMESLGIRLEARRADAAGLALATGAIEVSLLDLTSAYAAVGRGGDYVAPRIFKDEIPARRPGLSRRACESLDDMLSSSTRRPNLGDADAADAGPWFMWKTGTSSGRRDAWAVGHNRIFAIGVWVGRLQGGGHIGQVGAKAAEPLLARLFALHALRNDEPPAPLKPWHAAHPLSAPVELAGPTRILSPADGATFIASGGTVSLPVRANRPIAVASWFLDGRLIDLTGDHPAIDVSPGRHELLCRDDRNLTTRVNFCVEAPEIRSSPLAANR